MASTSLSDHERGAGWRRALATGRGLRISSLRLSRQLVAILIVLAAALAFYMWTADSSIPFDFSADSADIYNLMATGFLHGHTYLPIKPPAGLLHLRDPYDPAQNAPYQAVYHDLSLRNGRFYSSWGPSPVLLFMAFRLTPIDLSQSFAAALYAFVGLAAAVALLYVLVKRLIPGTPAWLLVFASAALALTNAAPFLLRRPLQYEVAIAGGYCFEMAGILLVVTAVLATPARLGRLAFGSLLLGLAVAARPTLAVGGLVALAAAAYLIRRRGASYRVLVPALVPVIICGLLLAAYNDVRFGSPSEFGQHYQLATIGVQHKPTDQLSFVPPGVFSYLVVPARASLTFPYVFLMTSSEYPGSLPAGYSGTGDVPIEPAGGMLTTMPITLLLFELPLLWRWRRRSERPALLVATGLAALCLAVIGLLAYALWGTTQRYEVDFATFGLLAAFLVWALLIARAEGRKLLRRTTIVLGVLLTAFGAAVGTATSFTGYDDLLQLTHPGTFRTLEDITSPLPTLATIVAGHPVLTRVSGPLPIVLPAQGYGAFGERGAGAWLGSAGAVTVTVIAPHSERMGLTATASPGPGAPPLSSIDVRVRSPGQHAITVPLISPSVRMPIDLHLGLNRITLSLAAPPATRPEELFLNAMALGP
jgi:hypothetical protein